MHFAIPSSRARPHAAHPPRGLPPGMNAAKETTMMNDFSRLSAQLRHATRGIARALLALLLIGVAAATVHADELAINVLSNRADLISGGDALVQVVVPADV